MLKHYEGKVDKMYVAVYRQDENDGVLEEVLDLGIKPCIIATEEKYNWERVTALYNYIKGTKPNDWWIVSDDDELQVYPYEISDIIKECEKHNFDFVTGGFLDRIGPDGIFPEVTRDTNIHSAFPYAGFFRYPMSKACPNKVTLMKGYQDICSGQHYATFKDGTNSWGKAHPKRMPIEEVFTQVHHFKWDATCVERIKEVADIDKPYAYSEEYRTMYNAIRVFDWKIDICNPEFKVEKLNNFSYIDYMDYTKWNLLRDKIVTI
jgi:hypothetical protein